MPRDYKHVRRPQDRRRGAPGWLWALAGLSVGLFVALLVYLDAHRLPVPSADAPAPAASPEPARPPPAPRPEDKPAAETRPRFEFYTILPEMEAPPSPGVPAPAPAGKPPGESYLLQVGAFRTYAEADRLKASLALLGLEATIQSVSVGGKPTVHRVRVGPFSDMAKVNDARRRLREQSLDSIVVKGKG